MARRFWLAFSLAALPSATTLDNGFTLPAMGYSSWNDCGSMRDNGPDGWCWDTEEHMKNITRYMIESGLAKLGYNRLNIDEGWLAGRDNTTDMIYEDLDKFPSGMKALGDWIKAQETYPGSGEYMHYGLYTCRGTCQCWSGSYHATGSKGYEKLDAEWMVAQGADYLKIDSCCTNGGNDHAVAFADFAKFRDALNATGTPVWLSLCGARPWYSPPDPALHYAGGSSLGNSWRIAGDGHDWESLTKCINGQADAAPYAGIGGWPDPDLLIGEAGYVGGQSDAQARAQFTMWSLFPANLLISQNMLRWSDYALETYSNAEVVAINQDPLGSAARRILGGKLSFPCDISAGGECANVWGRKLSGGDFALGMVNNGAQMQDVTCDAACFASMGMSAKGSYTVRDLWAHRVVATVSSPYSFTATVNISGSASLFRLTPVSPAPTVSTA